ncbi:MAG: formate--tetrahydrofolate ligase [bacterium]
MKSDLAIAQATKIQAISQIAKKLGLEKSEYDLYGRGMAKINLAVLERIRRNKLGKYIDVTAITPTPLGEGKTTTTIGLGMALNKLGKKTVIAIRQPSMGPTFGIKGGAAGGGYAQVLPMEEFNLHFTGDIHAIGVAHNLIAAMLDNHLVWGNELDINLEKIIWPRVLDVSDRSLRKVSIGGKNSKLNGISRTTQFDITVASELMAIIALATSIMDLRARIDRTIVAYTSKDKPVTVGDLKVTGAAIALLLDAIKPNLIQTLDHTPVIVHAGPFANIAHGNSSILADQIGLRLADYLVTESGFGADIGMEKFMDIKCRYSGLKPDAVVLVATVRAIKYHSGNFKVIPGKSLPTEMLQLDLESVQKGLVNLEKQIANAKLFGIPVIIAINRFQSDHQAEITLIKEAALKAGVEAAVISEVFAKGSKGGIALANAVITATSGKKKNKFRFLYQVEDPLEAKIATIAREIYGASGVDYSAIALAQIKLIKQNHLANLPICMAKTHLSLSDNPLLVGAPKNFRITVEQIKIAAGAGFIYPLLGKMRTMPGLPRHANAEKIDITQAGKVTGLF